MHRNLNILYSLFVFTLLISFSQATTLEETFKKRIPAADKSQLVLENRNGSITISSWRNDEVEIVAYKRVKAGSSGDAHEIMNGLEVRISDRGKSIDVETLFPRKHEGGFLSQLFSGGHVNMSVDYEVRVPAEFDLDIQSTNGGIFVEDCAGMIQLKTTNGKISAKDIAGAVKLKSTNGSIKASLNEFTPDKDMSIVTTNGSIKLYLPVNIDADLEARTTNGSIRCNLPVEKTYHKSKRRLEARINDGGPAIYLKTTNGSIRVDEN